MEQTAQDDACIIADKNRLPSTSNRLYIDSTKSEAPTIKANEFADHTRGRRRRQLQYVWSDITVVYATCWEVPIS